MNGPSSSARGERGGSWFSTSSRLLAANRFNIGGPANESGLIGFRVASAIPEPSTLLLAALAALCLFWRKRRAP